VTKIIRYEKNTVSLDRGVEIKPFPSLEKNPLTKLSLAMVQKLNCKILAHARRMNRKSNSLIEPRLRSIKLITHKKPKNHT